jgi:hypothetical protein
MITFRHRVEAEALGQRADRRQRFRRVEGAFAASSLKGQG